MDSGDWSDILCAILVSILLAGGLVWVAMNYREAIGAPPLVLAGLFGASVGWVTGILVSPYDKDERSAFGEMAKLIYGFLSGYLVSKIDPIITDATKSGNEKQLIIGAFALISFLAAVAVTYITRRYWTKKPMA